MAYSLFACIIGIAAGGLNGFLVTKFKLPIFKFPCHIHHVVRFLFVFLLDQPIVSRFLPELGGFLQSLPCDR